MLHRRIRLHSIRIYRQIFKVNLLMNKKADFNQYKPSKSTSISLKSTFLLLPNYDAVLILQLKIRFNYKADTK